MSPLQIREFVSSYLTPEHINDKLYGALWPEDTRRTINVAQPLNQQAFIVCDIIYIYVYIA